MIRLNLSSKLGQTLRAGQPNDRSYVRPRGLASGGILNPKRRRPEDEPRDPWNGRWRIGATFGSLARGVHLLASFSLG